MEEKNVQESLIEKEIQSSYLDYAMSVIIGRALPDARDGLKPAQRRILWAMYGLSNFHDQPTKKSARIIGECIGKFHPHGDIAAYETLVRMAQEFSMNHTLVQGQGNMGSIDGDPAAAQRYTEVRLNKLAEEMLVDIDKESVPLVSNFDNTEKEPAVLPAKVPNLLINGASGIAVGVTTNIMQHNLAEVCNAIIAYLDNPEIKPEEILEHIKGPDFATGGIVFYNKSLKDSYIIGRGSCTIRGKTVIESNNGREVIIVTEIPYAVNKAQLVQKIAELVKNKQIQGISDLRDESGKDGIRIYIELKKGINSETVLNTLYKHTQMQVSIPVVNNAVIESSLITFNIKQMIKAFVDHRINVIKNRTRYELNIASERLHIVEGLLVAINEISGVISTIKDSADTKEARARLIESYKISEKQANAILDMKLSKLTALENGALNSEKQSLHDNIKVLKEILENDGAVIKIIKEETGDIKEKYGRPRRTVIEVSEGVDEIEDEDLIVDEEVTIILTKGGYMKRMNPSVYREQSRGGKGIRAIELHEGDFVKQILTCRSKDYLLIITNKGRAYWLKTYAVPEESRYSLGKASINLIKLTDGEKIEKIVNTRIFDKNFITIITKKGRIKRVNAERFSKPRSSGVMAMPVGADDFVSDACISDGGQNIFIATEDGKALRFNESDIRPMGRNAHGVRGVRLRLNDHVVNMLQAKGEDMVATISEKGYGKITKLEEYRLQKRGGKGVINLKVNEKTGKVVKSLKVSQYNSIILINSKGISIQFPISEIRITGRSASGVRLMKVTNDARVVDAQVI